MMQFFTKYCLVYNFLALLCPCISLAMPTERLLSCSGFGLQRIHKEKILLAKGSITERELIAGESLNLDFLSIVGFEVEFDEETKFSAYFAEEDIGIRKNSKVSLKTLDNFKNFKTGIEVNIRDGETNRSYWRIEVICGVGAN